MPSLLHLPLEFLFLRFFYSSFSGNWKGSQCHSPPKMKMLKSNSRALQSTKPLLANHLKHFKIQMDSVLQISLSLHSNINPAQLRSLWCCHLKKTIKFVNTYPFIIDEHFCNCFMHWCSLRIPKGTSDSHQLQISDLVHFVYPCVGLKAFTPNI